YTTLFRSRSATSASWSSAVTWFAGCGAFPSRGGWRGPSNRGRATNRSRYHPSWWKWPRRRRGYSGWGWSRWTCSTGTTTPGSSRWTRRPRFWPWRRRPGATWRERSSRPRCPKDRGGLSRPPAETRPGRRKGREDAKDEALCDRRPALPGGSRRLHEGRLRRLERALGAGPGEPGPAD